MLQLDKHDAALVEVVREAMLAALRQANSRTKVAKRLAALAVRERNKGRAAAINRHPFRGVCEVSGRDLDRVHAHLDEMDPEQGYDGPVRWVCQVANNSGRHSCGGCRGPATASSSAPRSTSRD